MAGTEGGVAHDSRRADEGESQFAPAARASRDELERAVRLAACSEVVNTLLTTSAGLLVILNSERQIVALNDAWLKAVGAIDAKQVLGLRPGEAIQCAHAQDAPAGCGTGIGCRRCGAVLAILASQSTGTPREEDCVLTIKTEADPVDFLLFVRASPLCIHDTTFTMLLLQDVTADRQRRMLERAFYHDVSNLVMGLVGTADLFESEPRSDWDSTADDVKSLAHRLADEISIQRMLASDRQTRHRYHLTIETLTLGDVQASVVRMIANHPAAAHRAIDLNRSPSVARVTFESDRCLLERCLMNLVLNALEATPEHGVVRIGSAGTADGVEFSVWNAGIVPVDVAPRLFQRFFSTKNGVGRGQGLFAVKLFCEDFLEGKVTYTTSVSEGTKFTLHLPYVAPGAKPKAPQ